MASMEFRYLTESDAEEASAFVHDMWVDTYSSIVRGGRQHAEEIFDDWVGPKKIVNDISRGHFFAYMLVDGERIGLVSAGKEGPDFEISKLYILPEYRHGGHGLEALDFLLDKGRELGCRRAHLEVNQNNTQAIQFYEKHGFRTVGVNEYEHSCTLTMAVELRPPWSYQFSDAPVMEHLHIDVLPVDSYHCAVPVLRRPGVNERSFADGLASYGLVDVSRHRKYGMILVHDLLDSRTSNVCSGGDLVEDPV